MLRRQFRRCLPLISAAAPKSGIDRGVVIRPHRRVAAGSTAYCRAVVGDASAQVSTDMTHGRWRKYEDI